MWWPWAAAAMLYLLFRLWYDNLRGRLSPDEVDAFIGQLKARGADDHNSLESFRSFLASDDGREFVMLNLVKVAPGTAAHPETGEQVEARTLLDHYSRHFIRRLIGRGGHPALAARKIGPYVDAWHVPPDPGWSIMGYMRYRSRRDLAILAADPCFGPLHVYQALGTAETFSFPTRPFLALYLTPRWWVAMLLMLVAALLQLTLG